MTREEALALVNSNLEDRKGYQAHALAAGDTGYANGGKKNFRIIFGTLMLKSMELGDD